MKGTFWVAIILMFSMLVIPLSTLDNQQEVFLSVANAQKEVVYDKNEKLADAEKVKVLKDEKILEYSIKDYIFGVVAAEMPALYEKEALKAQAVAAYTYVCYKKEESNNTEYDISADPQVAQCFITREEAITRWGENAQEYQKKIDDCIAEVQGEIITYNGKPIFAAYHAISAGITNDSKDVWGGELPYLKSVNSEGDETANGFLTEVKLTASELAEKLNNTAAASGEAKDYFANVSINEAGYVKTIEYCGKKISGTELAKALELRSGNFTVEYAEDVFCFKVKGYGHGVGMSQTGADYMAKQGKTYKEILSHYYTGTMLQKNKNFT